jgi:hypothetical protein
MYGINILAHLLFAVILIIQGIKRMHDSLII